ncbi:hypothetical protein G7Y89_g11503 [Cudoniella acicularis]|uniref:Uncharacterized protein n=1 Tax=Cudoniella acicularis TaxID=354080 RepID=A0A8H4W026_9HELO|nr:hypothetical protein G7Y89_g11503 [Cudoniella acicularis]
MTYDDMNTETLIRSKIKGREGRTVVSRTSVATEATSESLLAPRIAQTPSLFKMIEQRNKENDRLRHKLAY